MLMLTIVGHLDHAQYGLPSLTKFNHVDLVYHCLTWFDHV